MHAKSDAQLLRDYAETGSESAFREIVVRHTDLVYSAAFRQVASPELARDVAQSVFTDLARKGTELAHARTGSNSLAGWLYRATRFAALNELRAERRRHTRERQAMEQFEPPSVPAPDWDRVQPLLDDAMSDLGDDDCEVLLLRFFHNRDFRAIGESLGVSDDAAQKRVTRALEKLRAEFVHRGVTTTAVALSTVISANAVSSAPPGLAATLSAVALAGKPLAAAATATAAKTIVMTAIQKASIAAAVALAAGTGLYEAHRASRLRAEVQVLEREQSALTRQLADFKSQSENLSNQLARVRGSTVNTERLRELLRLRGEVGLLRRRQRDLEQTVAAPQSNAGRLAGQPAPGATPRVPGPAPFQVQLVADEPGDNTETLTNTASGGDGETLQVQKTPLLDHTAIRSATVTKDANSGAPQIEVEFSAEGQDLFAAITREHINKRLAIVLNGQVYSAPVIRSEISQGKAQITGHFTEEEARELAARINDVVRGQ